MLLTFILWYTFGFIITYILCIIIRSLGNDHTTEDKHFTVRLSLWSWLGFGFLIIIGITTYIEDLFNKNK